MHKGGRELQEALARNEHHHAAPYGLHGDLVAEFHPGVACVGMLQVKRME